MTTTSRAACAAAIASVILALPNAALAQAYPSKTIQAIIPFAPGGKTKDAIVQGKKAAFEFFGQMKALDLARSQFVLEAGDAPPRVLHHP